VPTKPSKALSERAFENLCPHAQSSIYILFLFSHAQSSRCTYIGEKFSNKLYIVALYSKYNRTLTCENFTHCSFHSTLNPKP